MSCSSPTNSHPQISTIPHSPAAALPSAKVLSETAPVDSTLSPFEENDPDLSPIAVLETVSNTDLSTPSPPSVSIISNSAITNREPLTSNPTTVTNSSNIPSVSAAPAPPSSSTRLCRNVIIYGYCKFQDKGCYFFHPPPPSPAQAQNGLASSSNISSTTASSAAYMTAPEPHKLRSNVTSFRSFMRNSAVTTNNLNYDAISEDQQVVNITSTGSNAEEGHSKVSLSRSYSRARSENPSPQGNGGKVLLTSSPTTSSNYGGSSRFTLAAPAHSTTRTVPPGYFQVGLSTVAPSPSPLMYHLYAAPLYNLPNLAHRQRTAHGFFVSERLREDLQRKSDIITRAMIPLSRQENKSSPTTNQNSVASIPTEIQIYHTIRSIPDVHSRLATVCSTMTGVGPSKMYTAVSRIDAKCYVLRRIEGFRGGTTQLAGINHFIEGWKRIRHANVVNIRDVFVTKAFGDSSLMVVYDYFPVAVTLLEKHFPSEAAGTTLSSVISASDFDLSWDTIAFNTQSSGPTSTTFPNNSIPEENEPGWLSEPVIWTYVSQLLSALKAIHAAGLAARVYDISNIYLTNKNSLDRVRVACCGVFDFLGMEPGKTIPHLQQEDMLHFGQLILTLACRSLNAVHTLQRSLDLLSRRYSMDFRRVVMFLLSRPSPIKHLDDLAAICGNRVLYELDAAYLSHDYLENELLKELENGRLVRLMIKLGLINERPEFEMDPRWSETGDRYLLKLFRDYVFHQVDHRSRPVADMAHIISCLNKLDAGVDEKIMLVSRDERSCLIVSYRELKGCVESAFRDLTRRS